MDKQIPMKYTIPDIPTSRNYAMYQLIHGIKQETSLKEILFYAFAAIVTIAVGIMLMGS